MKRKYFIIALTILLMLLFCFPIFMAVLTSVKTQQEISRSILSFPTALHLENYTEAMERSDFTRSLINSCIVTFPSVALIIVGASMGGYAIARHAASNRAFRCLDKIYLASLMIPFQILMIPIYKMYKALKLQNSLFGMILILTGTSIAYATFLYVGFVKSIPIDIEEAAMIDGCNPVQTFFRVVFPIMKPTAITVAILNTMWIWNDYLLPYLVIGSDYKTIPVAVQYLRGGYGSVDMGHMMAVLVLAIIPIIIFYIFCQKYIIEGVVAGAVKG